MVWLWVGLGWSLLLSIGWRLGWYLSRRFPPPPPRGDSGPAPEPPPPTFGVDWPELGSHFDRTLLPEAFEDATVAG